MMMMTMMTTMMMMMMLLWIGAGTAKLQINFKAPQPSALYGPQRCRAPMVTDSGHGSRMHRSLG